MRRPRRLFRSASPAGGKNVAMPGARALVIAGLVVAAVGLVSSGLSSDLFGRVPPVAGTLIAPAGAVAVVDGETLRLHDTVIRLSGVQAPHRGARCQAADGGAYDCGREAAAALGRLLRGQDVACRLVGRDPHGLPQGECAAGGTAVNQAIVAAGWARAAIGAGGDGLADDERQARAAMRGVWQGPRDPFL